jgi:signal transduction histidine kinase
MLLFTAMSGAALLIVVAVIWIFARRLGRNIHLEIEAEKLDSAIKMADAAAHELRQPMTVVSGLSELLEDKVKNGEDISEYVSIITGQCVRMNSIIERMVNVTSYRTKSYDGQTEIFDISADEGRDRGAKPGS